MKRITTTQKISFGAVLMLGLVIVGYYYFYKHLHSLHLELDEVKQEIAVMDQYASNKDAAVALLEETKKNREMLVEYFVPLDNPVTFINLIESAASESGVALKVETLGETDEENEANEEDHKNVKAVLAVNGEWREIYHFISLLENLPFATIITKVTLSEDDKADEFGQWKGQIHTVSRTK